MKNEFKASLRFTKKNLIHFFINVLGLSIGITSCLLVFTFIEDELDYNTHYEQKERIYRLDTKITTENLLEDAAVSPAYIGELVEENLSSVESVVRILDQYKKKDVVFGIEEYTSRNVIKAEPSFFNIFSVNSIEGSLDKALEGNRRAVISNQLASTIFGNAQNAIGKSIEVDLKKYQITSVVDNQHQNSDLYFDAILSLDDNDLRKSYWSTVYILTKQIEDQSEIQQQVDDIVNEHIGGNYSNAGIELKCELIPFTDIYFSRPKLFDSSNKGSIKLNISLALLAIFVVFIAAFNYSNIFIGQFFVRSKERYLRKMMGASKSKILSQYLLESALTTLVSIGLSIILLAVFMPKFNEITGKNFDIISFFSPGGLLLIGIIGFAILMLSSIGPIHLSLKSFNSDKVSYLGSPWVRTISITTQLSISLIMIITALLINNQMSFLSNYDLGYKKTNVAFIEIPDDSYQSKLEVLINNFKLKSEVKQVSICTDNSLVGKDNDIEVYTLETEDDFINLTLNNFSVDENFTELLDIDLIEGLNFESADEGYVLVNQKLVDILGWDNPVGKEIRSEYGFTYTVAGVVDNFHFKSLRYNLDPLILQYSQEGTNVLLSFENDDIKGQIDLIKEVWYDTYKDVNVEYSFINDILSNHYKHEMKANRIISLFAIVSIMICGLGMFGLSYFIIQKKLSEICIRKIVGANFMQITYFVTKDFIRSFGIAILISVPLVVLIVKSWLEDFTYRVGIEVIPFLLAVILIGIIISISLTYFIIRVVKVNPVEILRDE